MPIREQEIDALARHFIEGLLAKNQIVAKAPIEDMLACVVELMSENFETEAQIDEEADRMAEAEARKYSGVDVNRLRTMIKQRLAEKKGFTL